ncbi:hypothetical protein GCM10027168_50930 [Streptomyces capparidis]
MNDVPTPQQTIRQRVVRRTPAPSALRTTAGEFPRNLPWLRSLTLMQVERTPPSIASPMTDAPGRTDALRKWCARKMVHVAWMRPMADAADGACPR